MYTGGGAEATALWETDQSCCFAYAIVGNLAYHSEDDEGDKWGDEEVESHVECPDACHPDGIGSLLSSDSLQQLQHCILPAYTEWVCKC